MIDKGYKRVKLALVIDFVSITVAVAVLLMTYKDMLPYWALIAGACTALVLLVVAVTLYVTGRKMISRGYQQLEEDVLNEP